MKILHLITGLNWGGAERMLTSLVTRSRAFEHEVISLIPPGLMAEPLRLAGVPVSSLGMRRQQPNPMGLVRLRRVLHQRPPDIIQTWLPKADLLGALAVVGKDIPVIWNLRNTLSEEAQEFVPWICARLSSRPWAVIANSYAGKATYEAVGYRPQRWHVIPNGFDTSVFRPDDDARTRVRPRLRISPRERVVAMVARRHQMKDHEMFVRAARAVADAVPDVRFVMIGQDVNTDPALGRLITDLGLTRQVLRMGVTVQVQSLLPAVDVGALSSRYGEGLPNAIGEAMSCGVPCVVTDVGDSARLVGDTGRVVAPSDEASFVRALVDLLRLPESERRALGARARARIESDFSLTHAISRYEALYEDLARELPAASARVAV